MATRITRGQDVFQKAKDELEKRNGKTVERLREEREKRFTDVIQLKVPDRMPVYLGVYHAATNYAGLPQSERFYHPANYKEAVLKMLLEFEPDIYDQSSSYNVSGRALEKLGTIQYKWPGGPLKSDQHPQALEMENMKGDEYDLFMTSPDDYMVKYYLPRAFSFLSPLAKLPSFRGLLGPYAIVPQLTRFISPETIQAFEAILQAAREQEKFEHEGLQLGFPVDLGFIPINHGGGGVVTPFDVLTDYLRANAGMAVDMFKQPEKLLAAMERLLEWHLARMVPCDPKEWGRRRVGGGGSHWSSEQFLSKKQFETFYWPTWKKSIVAAIDLGYIPVLGCEVTMDDRLEYFLELPKGKVLFHNDIRDIAKAKEILGGHMAFMGGMTAAMLHFASPQEVEECCKKMIEVGGKGGGFILNCRAGEDDAKPENIKAMVDAVRKYGRY